MQVRIIYIVTPLFLASEQSDYLRDFAHTEPQYGNISILAASSA